MHYFRYKLLAVVIVLIALLVHNVLVGNGFVVFP
jgi:hypothetical protein